MQSGKTRTWANDDTMAQAQASAETATAIAQPPQEKEPSEEKPSQPKKARTTETLPPASTEAPQPTVVDHSGEDGTEAVSAQEDKNEEEAGPVSDMDWLRSKTSRLLGLLDEEEQAEFDERKAEEPEAPQSPVKGNSRIAEIEDEEEESAPQPATDLAADEPMDDAEESTEEDRISPEQAKNIDLIRTSARLFLRNLSYQLKEADLQPLFAPFGKTEEVSTSVLHSQCPVSHSPPMCQQCAFIALSLALRSYDDYPDRDSLCQKANDVTRQEILVDASWFSEEQHHITFHSSLQDLWRSNANGIQIHIAFDTRTETSKGFAYVQYHDADAAVEAYRALDGKHFQGRLLHILPAAAKKSYKIDEYELSKLPLKKQKQIKRKMESTSSSFSWNSLYMNVSYSDNPEATCDRY